MGRKAVAFQADIAQLQAFSGNHEQARQVLDALLESARKRFVSPYDIAVIYAGLGRRDEAFSWLARAAEVRPFWISLVQVDPRLDSLRSDPRFAELVQRLRPATS